MVVRTGLTNSFLIAFLISIGILGACTPGTPLQDPGTEQILFPHSVKGYEFYVWEQNDALWFTLITGTNREKTYEEIISPEGVWSSDGWVAMSVQGLDEGLALLERVPAGEFVILLNVPEDMRDLAGGNIQSPPGEVIADIETAMKEIGLKLLEHD